MRHFKHPATIIALIALFAALSGAAGATVTTLISGTQIKHASIPENRLQASAIKDLRVTGMAHTTSSGGGHCSRNTLDGTYTWCGAPATVKFNAKTAALVTGSLDLASNDGIKMQTELGVCYAPHGSSTLTLTSEVYPEFEAPSGSYFANAVTGVIGGLKGSYDVGMCLDQQTTNTNNGDHAVSVLITQTSNGVTKLG